MKQVFLYGGSWFNRWFALCSFNLYRYGLDDKGNDDGFRLIMKTHSRTRHSGMGLRLIMKIR